MQVKGTNMKGCIWLDFYYMTWKTQNYQSSKKIPIFQGLVGEAGIGRTWRIWGAMKQSSKYCNGEYMLLYTFKYP